MAGRGCGDADAARDDRACVGARGGVLELRATCRRCRSYPVRQGGEAPAAGCGPAASSSISMASACDGALRIRCSPLLAVADLASAADLAAEPAGLSTPPRGGCSSPSFSAFLPDDEAPRVPDSLPLAGAPPPRKSARSTACKGQTAQEEHGTPRGSWTVRGAKGKRWMDRQTDNVYLIHVCACDRARVRVRVSVRACVHEATVQRFWWIDRRRERSWPSRQGRGPHASLPVTKIWRDLLYPEQLGPTAWLTLETRRRR